MPMDRQQAINLEINRRFEEQGIAYAFPTRTLHLASAAAPSDTPTAAWE
jgi:small-conductance mechanosensitive channel